MEIVVQKAVKEDCAHVRPNGGEASDIIVRHRLQPTRTELEHEQYVHDWICPRSTGEVRGVIGLSRGDVALPTTTANT